MNLYKTNRLYCSLLLLSLFFAEACINTKTNSSSSTDSQKEPIEEKRLGGFLPTSPYNRKTVDLRDLSIKIEAFDLKGFPKIMETYGTLFAIMPNVPDEFVQEVATSFHQMFPQDSSLDLEKQAAVLSSMQQYGSLIPVLAGRYETASQETEEGLEKLSQDYSVCDIIMYKDGTGRQTMEVVEHLLHYVTSIGLHIADPAAWSFTDSNSKVTQVMNKAIASGLYQIESYSDILEEDKDAYQRVLVQEFAYWLISTYWDLQEPYGPLEEEEWNVDNKAQLLEKLPEGYHLVENSIQTFMRAPSLETLEKFRKYN